MKRNNSYLKGNKFAVGRGPNQTSFKDGNEPWNKGLKGWVAPGSEKGHFAKGSRPKNYMPIGTISTRTDKAGALRRWIKISDGGRPQDRWKPYAQWLWEKEKGLIPNGLIVHHLDRDSMNDNISNYALVSRSNHINSHRKDLMVAKKRKLETA